MLFNSVPFLVLLLITFVFYYLPFLARFQKVILIVASFVFYGYSQPRLLLLFIFNVLVCTYASYRVSRSSDPRERKFFATAGVAVTLAILAFFKYNRLLAHTLLLDQSHGVGAFLVSIPLPIGISFYTFQGISLVVDVFREPHVKFKPLVIEGFWSHFYRTTFFKSFFPQLVAGPIVKAHDFFYQIGIKRLKEVNWGFVTDHLILGYFLKCVVADNLKDQTYWITFPFFQTQPIGNLLSMLFGYSMQIFADFAGYSYIAVGLAKLFGYDFFENFDWPYLSTSFSEFWKRWHISLSSFLREYLYIPLGGNRNGPIQTYRNLFITMFLGGLWHGAAWSYAVWGSTHGLALAIERLCSEKLTKTTAFVGPKIQTALAWATVFTVVSLAWLLFKLPEFSQAKQYMRAIWENRGEDVRGQQLFLVLIYSLPVVLLHLKEFGRDFCQRWSLLIHAVMLFLIITNRGGAGEFIYFQF